MKSSKSLPLVSVTSLVLGRRSLAGILRLLVISAEAAGRDTAWVGADDDVGAGAGLAGVAADAGFAGADVAGLEGAQEEPPRGAEREDMEMRAGCEVCVSMGSGEPFAARSHGDTEASNSQRAHQKIGGPGRLFADVVVIIAHMLPRR